MDDVGFGIALGQKRRANEAQAAALVLAEHIRGQRDEVEQLRARIAELEKANAVLWQRAADAEADAAGREAQFDALMQQHPDSPLFADSGRRFRDGTPKTRIRLIYEAAFDAVARRWKIADPASRRAD